MTALVKRESQSLAYNQDQIQTIKDTFAKGANDAELRLFIAVAERRGLDIFARQIHLVKRWDNEAQRFTMDIQTGIDGFRKLAEDTGLYDGQIGPEWCGKDGTWVDVWLHDEPPAAARVGILKKGIERPFFGVALYSEYVQLTKSGAPNRMWQKMRANQLAKCAEALALRKAFPSTLSGLYTQEEMAQANNGAPDEVFQGEVVEEKPKRAAKVKPAASSNEAPQVEVAAVELSTAEAAEVGAGNNDPLPPLEDKENAAIEARKARLIAEMKAAICGAGATEAEFDDFARDKDLHNRTVKWLEDTLPKIIAKVQPKSPQPEPASGFAAEREDGARKVLRKNADGEPVAVFEDQKTPLQKIDDLIESWREKGQDLATIKAQCERWVGIFTNWSELDAAQQVKLIQLLTNWEPKPKEAKKK